MAKDDSYEIMPYKEIVELRKQIGDLQKKTGEPGSKDLLVSMESLTKSMNNMLQLFSSAAEEMKLEERTESELSKKIAPMIEKLDRIEEQNKTIAEGLVAVASMMEDIRRGKISPPKPKVTRSEPEKSPVEEALEPNIPPLLEPSQTQEGPMVPPRMPGPMPMSYRGGLMPGPMPPGQIPPGPMPPGMFPGPMPPGDFNLPPLPPFEEEPRKKGIFGFKKK
jgi:hypothetical protein